MTAARSDLMLEQAHYVLKNLDAERPGCGYLKLAEACRLAASQPDRETVARAFERIHEIAGEGGFLNRNALIQEICRKQIEALSLLSGAVTKSDGGVEGHARMDACGLSDDSLRGGANSSNERGGAGIKPGPSDPSPGPVKPAPIADSSEAGRGDAERTDYKALFEMHESALIELWSLLGANGQHDAVTKLRALSAPVGEPYAYAKQIGSDIVRTHSLKHMMPEARAEYTIPLYTHPPAPAVGPDVREALGESSQTLEYLRREARTWGKIFSVNVDHVLDKNRKALSALTRPLGGFVQGSIARKQSSDPEGSSRTETALDILEQNCWDLRCVDIPTGAGDADIGWHIVEHHMAPPKERIIGYGNAPLDALMDAMSRGPK